jgi:hypothetical protein
MTIKPSQPDGQPMITVYVSPLLDGQELPGYRRVGAVFEPYFDLVQDRIRWRPKSPIPLPTPDEPWNELGFFSRPKGGRLLERSTDWTESEEESGF